MAYDKVVDSAFLEAGLTLVGDSIRAKGGTSAKLEFPNGMKAAVDAIDTSKPEQTKTATPSLSQQTIVPDSGKTLSGVTINPITAALLTSLDPDFKPENIAKDANLFGLVGTHAGGGNAAHGTATAANKTITVTGLGFKPEHVAAVLQSTTNTDVRVIGIWDSKYINKSVALGNVTTLTLDDDGFSIYINVLSSSMFSGEYAWVAWAA